jgi:hypothetical protein
MTICAWCDDTIEAGPAAAAAPVSHGICPSCLDAKLAAVAAPRVQIARTGSALLGGRPFGPLPAPAPVVPAAA